MVAQFNGGWGTKVGMDRGPPVSDEMEHFTPEEVTPGYFAPPDSFLTTAGPSMGGAHRPCGGEGSEDSGVAIA